MECKVERSSRTGDPRVRRVRVLAGPGKLVLFKAKAVVLATGGVGKAWKITSNSWEYTGDGHHSRCGRAPI